MRRRVLAFVVLAVACTCAVAVTVAIAVVGARADREELRRAAAAARPSVERVATAGEPFAVFRELDRDHPESYGRMVVAPLTAGRPGAASPVGLFCERVAYGGGRGLCLDLLGAKMRVSVLDARFDVADTVDLAGVPSRARVSPDGRWGGVTAFVLGHTYAAPGAFSTETTIIDLRSGKVAARMEQDITLTHDGAVLDDRSRNFWGLTFAADGDTFYATVAVAPHTWLIEGSIARRTARTIHANVECPSLSPDGTRIAYKKAVAQNPSRWRFHVLDLATGRSTPLPEPRSIDDQLAWLDDERLLYGDGEATWVVDADGQSPPERWLPAADSVVVAG
jgi:WD40-like Beta Propeller Repeat